MRGVITTGPVPKHLQVRDRIVAVAVPGQAIPSERALMAELGVSRETVRRAIDGLVADGLLQRSHGLGTFAVRPVVESQLHLASFSHDMRRRGLVPGTHLISVTSELPIPEVQVALGLQPGQLAWRIVRIRLADGDPIAHEDGWYPAAELPGLEGHDLAGDSLYQILRDAYGHRID
ncbi:MAG: GntR family transcriptional regulator, partial [Propionicimonas sp.]|nr:GntR family transcriptional regulator [Propionicimonas sp.]